MTSVTRSKSPNVYKSCPKINSLEKWRILTPLQKLPKNVDDLVKIIVATGFELLPKMQKIAKPVTLFMTLAPEQNYFGCGLISVHLGIMGGKVLANLVNCSCNIKSSLFWLIVNTAWKFNRLQHNSTRKSWISLVEGDEDLSLFHW